MRHAAYLLLGAGAFVFASLRWLRVAQREHYLPGSVWTFAKRWWGLSTFNRLLGALALAAALGALAKPWTSVLTSLVVAVGPIGLGLRGRTGALSWTKRLKLLAGAQALLGVVVGVLLVELLGFAFAAAATALAAPVLLELALRLTAPVQRREMNGFVASAVKRLAEVDPRVVAITGSYGKTSTKGHLAHLLAGSRAVVASPASFNNRAGLARTINEHLEPGTEVLVAEMGTYGIGEIAEMCAWCPPDVAVITAIGPVHLERMGSMNTILDAKMEVAEEARVVVLNVMDPRLGQVVDRLRRLGKEVVTVATAPTYGAQVALDASVVPPVLHVRGASVPLPGPLPEGVRASNLACAFGAVLGLGLDPMELVDRVATMPAVANRANVGVSASGVVVVDDTFNANPEGARAAIEVLGSLGKGGRRVVVTPGMVELGREQAPENKDLAAAASKVADTIVVVGRTNAAALVEGAGRRTTVIKMPNRDAAVAWVRANLSEGDAVLYENDLPDHYA